MKKPGSGCTNGLSECANRSSVCVSYLRGAQTDHRGVQTEHAGVQTDLRDVQTDVRDVYLTFGGGKRMFGVSLRNIGFIKLLFEPGVFRAFLYNPVLIF